MLLEKINEHYENLIKNHFEYIEIELTKKGLVIQSENEYLLKLHKICQTIPETLILHHIETILLFAQNRRTPESLFTLIDSIQDKIKPDYFINIKKEYQYYRFDIYHKRYDYLVHSFIDNHDNEGTIRERIDAFFYQDVKLPEFVQLKIFNDIEKSFLNGYDINFENYHREIILASSDKSDFMVVHTNKTSGKQIVTHPIQINEQTGDVFFAGKFENLMRT